MSKSPKVEVLPIEQGATPDPQNINKHTQKGGGLLENSLRKRGAFRSIASVGKGVETPVVMAGNFTLEKAIDAGFTEIVNVHVTGNQIVNVVRDDLEPGSAEAIALGLEDNEIGKQSYNPDIDILAAVMADPAMQALKAEDKILASIVDGMGMDVSGVEKGKKPNPRKLPLDVIFTYDALYDPACTLAARAGWKIGTQSTQKESGKPHTAVYQPERWSWLYSLCFLDNDYFNYNHAKHLEIVKLLKPKYATVRDVMTEEQCFADKIEYYPITQILEWAEELSQYCENVIVIPKYDCIKDIPKKFMLGYSIPTSHGGTPLPVDLFRGRRVHLLGGSWKAQLEYLAALGDDVVSIDNNYIQKQAQYASFVNPDGSTGDLSNIGLGHVNNPMYIALAISLGSIGAKVNELYGGNGQPADKK